MKENYRQAALRHWNDANTLENNQRFDNADQLYGLAAECAVKSALLALPGFCADTGDLDANYKTHINHLIGKVPLQNLHKPYPNLAILLKASNPFSDWSVKQRYGEDDLIAAEVLAKHKKAAGRLFGAVGLNGSRSP